MTQTRDAIESAIWWERGLFLPHEGASAPCPEEIDVGGPARVLVFGPM